MSDKKPEELKEPLPDWAKEKAKPDRITVGQQLYTKDGSIVGNGAVVAIYAQMFPTAGRWEQLYIVLTDAGNVTRYTLVELLARYKPGEFILREYPGDPFGNETWTRL